MALFLFLSISSLKLLGSNSSLLRCFLAISSGGCLAEFFSSFDVISGPVICFLLFLQLHQAVQSSMMISSFLTLCLAYICHIKVKDSKSRNLLGWCIIIAAFFSLKIGILFNFFLIKIFFSFQLSKIISIFAILCPLGMEQSHFTISINFLKKEQSSKSQAERWHTPHCLLSVDAFRYSFG